MKLTINNLKFEVELKDTTCANEIKELLPIEANLDGRVGDEVYFYTDIDCALEKDAKEVMEIGDVVYWRSPESGKKAIAIFFGNTPQGDNKRPQAVGPCNVIGGITGDISQHAKIKKGDKIILEDDGKKGSVTNLGDYIDQNSVVLIDYKDINPDDLKDFESSMGCILGDVFCYFDQENNFVCVEMADINKPNFKLEEKLEALGFNFIEDEKLINKIKEMRDRYQDGD